MHWKVNEQDQFRSRRSKITGSGLAFHNLSHPCPVDAERRANLPAVPSVQPNPQNASPRAGFLFPHTVSTRSNIPMQRSCMCVFTDANAAVLCYNAHVYSLS